MQFEQLLKTRVILILNFSRIHCDYLSITQRAKLLNFSILKTAAIFGRGHRSRTLLICLQGSFAHFLKTFSHHSELFFVFSFSLVLLSSSVNYLETRRHCYRKTTSRLTKLLLGNLRTNRERVILPSSRSKIKKKYSLH